MRIGSFVGLALVLAALLAGTAAAVPFDPTGDPLEPRATQRTTPERVQRILSDVVADPALPVEVAGQELAALGPDVLPWLFDALRTSVESTETSVDRTESTLLYAFCLMPAVRLTPFLESRATVHATSDVRIAALRILAETSCARDVSLILRFANDASGDASVERALESTVDALLARDLSTYAALERSYHTTPTTLRPAIVRAVARAESSEGLRLLSRLLHRDDELRPLLLVSIGRMSGALPRPMGEDVLSNVRRFVLEADPIALPEAILAVGYLDDCESIPQLIALLKSSRRGLRANALWSLKRITSLGIAETPERWTSWYQSEREWWHDEWPSVLADLRGAHSDRAKIALTKIATRHLFRHALASEVVQLVTHNDVDVATLACRTLGQLESRAALPGLIEALRHDDMILRMAAWNALRTITEKDLPPDAAAWSAMRLGS